MYLSYSLIQILFSPFSSHSEKKKKKDIYIYITRKNTMTTTTTTESTVALCDQWLALDWHPPTRAQVQEWQQSSLALSPSQDQQNPVKTHFTTRMTFGTAGLRAAMGPGYDQMNPLTILQTTQGLTAYLRTRYRLGEDQEKDGADKSNNNNNNNKKRFIVVGYDARHNSQHFGQITAAVFATLENVTVVLHPTPVATPILAFSILHLQKSVPEGAHVLAAVMITASHNPKEDNGYKLYGEDGCQIIPPVDENVAAAIEENLKIWPQFAAKLPQCFTQENVHAMANVNTDMSALIIQQYYKTCTEALCFPPIDPLAATITGATIASTTATNTVTVSPAASGCSSLPCSMSMPTIVYTPMHGVGGRFVLDLFQHFGFPADVLEPVPEQMQPDPEFPTIVFPNPEEGKSALDRAMRLADRIGAKFILANDPDADRLAVAEKIHGHGDADVAGLNSWKVFNGNEIASLLAMWMWQNRVHVRSRGLDSQDKDHCQDDDDKTRYAMVASTVSSKMLEAMASVEKFQFHEALTGFKWLSHKLIELQQGDPHLRVLLTYEEAIGYMCTDVVLDKDGVATAAVFAQLIRYLSSQGWTLQQYLTRFYDKYGYHLSYNGYLRVPPASTLPSLLDSFSTSSSSALPTDFTSVTDLVFSRFRARCSTSCFPSHFLSFRVMSVRDLTRGTDTSTGDGRALLPTTPTSQFITFRLRDKSRGWQAVVSLRGSGTEPKLKYYSELKCEKHEADNGEAQKALRDLVENIIVECLEPEKYGLKR